MIIVHHVEEPIEELDRGHGPGLARPGNESHEHNVEEPMKNWIAATVVQVWRSQEMNLTTSCRGANRRLDRCHGGPGLVLLGDESRVHHVGEPNDELDRALGGPGLVLPEDDSHELDGLPHDQDAVSLECMAM